MLNTILPTIGQFMTWAPENQAISGSHVDSVFSKAISGRHNFEPSLHYKTNHDARPYTAPHPGGWQSATHRRPVPFDAVSGATGGGFEWYEPSLPESLASKPPSLLQAQSSHSRATWNEEFMIPNSSLNHPSTGQLIGSSSYAASSRKIVSRGRSCRHYVIGLRG